MQHKKAKMPQKLLRAAVVICICAACLTSLGITFAKYSVATSGGDTAYAARFSPSLTFDDVIDVSSYINYPGDVAEKAFTVQNFSGDSVTEVTLKYKIVVKTTGNLPLQFSILNSEGAVLKTWPCGGTGAEQVYEYEDGLFVFSPGLKSAHSYKLKFEWPLSQNGAQFAEMPDAVYLSVVWQQVD